MNGMGQTGQTEHMGQTDHRREMTYTTLGRTGWRVSVPGLGWGG